MKLAIQYELACGFAAVVTMLMLFQAPERVPFGLLAFCICLGIKAYLDKDSGASNSIVQDKMDRLNDEIIDLRGQINIMKNRLDG